MANVAAVVSSIRNIMRQDRGISGDAQRLEQLGWMLFLKIIDDKDQELEILKDDYQSVIPEKFQWRTWASDPEGITGDDLLDFIDSNAQSKRGLFATLRNLSSINNPKRAAIVKEVFDGSNNYMKSGYEMRKVINKLNEVDFNNSDDKHIFGNIYESILQELRDAGNKGEYYTPRAVTQFMTQMTNPSLGEKVLDPAAGTGGFLSAAIDHIRENYVNTVDDEHILQKSITGWELKPVAYVLGLTNLILHEIDVPDYHYIDSLKKEYNSIGKKDQVDVILANPPFGASIAEGVESNFPSSFRCRESADLFVVLMLKLLNHNGRAAIILPDGCIKGEGVKARIHKKLLTECNLHTIIRMPTSTFFPAAVRTNLLFFEKGKKTNDIWYYEHKLPKGQKSYSKTKPIEFDEFQPIIKWWQNREESSVSWKVNVSELIDWDLDIKNPYQEKIKHIPAIELYEKYNNKLTTVQQTFSTISKNILFNRIPVLDKLLQNNNSLFLNIDFINKFKKVIILEGLKGNLSKGFSDKQEFKSGELLSDKMLEEKAIIFEEERLKPEKSVIPIEKQTIPYEIPNHWCWNILDNVSIFYNGKAHEKLVDSSGQYILVNSKFVSTNGSVKKHSTEILVPLKKNDIAIVMSDVPNGRALSRCYLVEENNLYTLNQRIGCLKSLCGIHPEYLKMVLDRNKYYLNFNDGKKQTNLKKSQILSCPIPIPPLEEQKHIIEQVNNLLKKCADLELEIESQNSLSENLIDSILNESF